MKALSVLLFACVSLIAGDDIPFAVGDGRIVIQNPSFIFENHYHTFVPQLSFTVVNETATPWRELRLKFHIGGLCNGEPRQWKQNVALGLGWTAERHVTRQYSDLSIPLSGKVDGCHSEIIKATLEVADNGKVRINGETGELIDLEKQLAELKAKQEAEAAKQVEEQRIAAEAQAKREAAEAERRKRLGVEQKRRDAERNARMAQQRAETEAKAAEERRRIRTACGEIYRNTADKKVSNLTVKEEQQVRACQALGLYPPQ